MQFYWNLLLDSSISWLLPLLRLHRYKVIVSYERFINNITCMLQANAQTCQNIKIYFCQFYVFTGSYSSHTKLKPKLSSSYGMIRTYLKINVSLTAPSSKSRIGSRAPTGQEFSVLRQHVPLCPQAV